ncbi:hypothetical protein BXL72_21795 [Salmonella enterica subsp. enterica serovar Enteritidis]|nr:hypothetical protein [Salmonella enterica subsp. enterica serovar Enteritidis]
MKSNLVAEIAAGLVGFAIMFVWGLGVLAIYAAVLLKLVDINSIFDIYFPGIFDIYFPGMTLMKWFIVAIMWSLVPYGIYIVGVALKVLCGQQKKNPPS